jgi:hypothetical protein
MNTKIIILLLFLFCITKTGFAQSKTHRIGNPKKDTKLYQEIYGDSYVDSNYYFEGCIASYKNYQNEFLNMGLNLEEMLLYGECSYNLRSPEKSIRYKSKYLYKIPVSVKSLTLHTVFLPLPFDLNANRYILKRLDIASGLIKGKDTVSIDFSNLDSLNLLYLDYYYVKRHPHVNIKFPPNLRILSLSAPLEDIISLPETLEELYIGRDTIYPFSKLRLPNLWLLHINGDKALSLPKELVNISSLKNIIIADSLTYEDVELLAKLSNLDTLSLGNIKNSQFPDNLYKLTNVTVIKINFDNIYIKPLTRSMRISIARDMQNILPNATILYKATKRGSPMEEIYYKYEKTNK